MAPPGILPRHLGNSGIMLVSPKINTYREENFCFHPPYPASPRTYLDEVGIITKHIANSQDRIMDLPGEIINLIFAPLSPAALDAMRFTCKAWWMRIMGDVSLLRSVLAPSSMKRTELAPDSRRPDQATRLRQLAAQLGRQSKIANASSSRDCWRLHYQRVDMKFTVPPLQLPPLAPPGFVPVERFEAIVAAKYWPPGDLLVLLVKQKPEVTQPGLDDTACPPRLLLYTFFSSVSPVHVGVISCFEDSTTFEINHGYWRTYSTAQLDSTTCLEIVLDKEIICASFTIQPGFERFESPFKLEIISSVAGSSISRRIRPMGDELIINDQLTYKDQDIWELVMGLYLPIASATLYLSR